MARSSALPAETIPPQVVLSKTSIALPVASMPAQPAVLLAPTSMPGWATLPPQPTASLASQDPAPAPTSLPVATSSAWPVQLVAFAADALQSIPVAGLTLAVRKPGAPDWIQGYGYANREQSILATPETVYPLGDLTMAFTAAAVMQLVERGYLDLDAPIHRYVEGLPQDFQELSLRQLLSRTSAINESVDTLALFSSQQAFTSQTLLQVLVPTLYVDHSRSSADRSYGNYILAGLIIEHVIGLSYWDYVAQNIASPLGLRHTQMCQPALPDLAQGYYFPSGSQFEVAPVNISAVFSAGGLCSTAGDLLNFMDALTSGRVVSPATYQMMITPTVNSGGSGFEFGLGLFLLPDSNGLQVDAISALEISPFAYVITYPERGLMIVVLSNTYRFSNAIFGRTFSIIPALLNP